MAECHVIWSNIDLDYDRDWKDELTELYPDASESERHELMYEINDCNLEDARADLNISLGLPILVIADLGLWFGRRTGYKVITSGNITDCLCAERDDDYVTWSVDELGDLVCRAHHHDGVNHYLYRVFKPGTTESQRDLLKDKIAHGKATRRDITKVTARLGDAIAKVYGFKIRNMKGE